MLFSANDTFSIAAESASEDDAYETGKFSTVVNESSFASKNSYWLVAGSSGGSFMLLYDSAISMTS
jgi:hypothetical protein